jgi:hypothetical protein
MRKFSSYGPIDTDLHYYAPREALIQEALHHLLGDAPDRGGHYITVWAPRQSGKTWLMQQVLFRLRHNPKFDVLKINLEHLKMTHEVGRVVQVIAEEIIKELGLKEITVTHLDEFYNIFEQNILAKPLILIMDEFDALPQEAINGIVSVFRNIYNRRRDEIDQPTEEKSYLLHSVALIGVRAVLGVENITGSPFNVQRSLHIPNLTFAEVEGLFKWYEQESEQQIDSVVVERLFYETQGQPGLTCWFGELLTETYNQHRPVIAMQDFEVAYAAATNTLPNANILNIISKARQEPYRQFVLELFETDEKILFRYDDSLINFLYLNGVVDQEVIDGTKHYVKFSSPFVQKRLFNYFAYELFREVGRLYEPFENLDDTITANHLDIKNLIRRYERYLKKNREWLLRNAPRKVDLRIYEAVYHFNLYMYLQSFLRSYDGMVYPEFPTGNGQIDLLLQYNGQIYGLELKTYTNPREYQTALRQAARYGKQLRLNEIALIFFVEYVDQTNRLKYEATYLDKETGVTITPIFVETGN